MADVVELMDFWPMDDDENIGFVAADSDFQLWLISGIGVGFDDISYSVIDGPDSSGIYELIMDYEDYLNLADLYSEYLETGWAELEEEDFDEVFAAPSDENIEVTFKIQDADMKTFYHTTDAPSGLSDEDIVTYVWGVPSSFNREDNMYHLPYDWEGVGDHFFAKIMSSEEEGSAPVQDPMEFGEMANWTPLDGTPSLKRRKDAEAGSFRDGTGCISKGSFPSMTCEHCGFDPHELVYYQCKQNDEDLTRDEWKEQLEFYFYEGSHGEQCQGLIDENKEAEGMTVGVNLEALEPTPDEPETGESMVPADSFMPEGSGHVIGSQSTSHNFTPFHSEDEDDFYQNAETFIAYPELKNHLVSIMPDKVYNINLMEDGDFQMSVANRYMDEVISAVSDYQATEKSESDFVFGQSKTTVAVAAASLAVVGAWLWNKRK